MENYSMKLKKCIDNDIEKGDVVKLTDGSGLSLKCRYDSINARPYYIIYSYKNITGTDEILKDCHAIVLEIGIKDYAVQGSCGDAYIQDVIVRIGNAEFRTCSQFVCKI